MDQWEVEYDDGGAIRNWSFQHEGTPTLEYGARELLRYLRNNGRDFALLDQPRSDGENAVQTLSAAGITVLEPRPIHDPS